MIAGRESNAAPIHVCHLIQGLGVGGMETMLVNMIAHLDSSRFKTSICCFDRLGPLADEVNAAAVEVTLVQRDRGFDWRYPKKLSEYLKHRNIDVLHLHNPTAFFYGTLAGKLARVSCIVYTEHGRDFSMGWKVKLVHRWIAKLVDRIVVVAEHGRRVLCEEEGIDEGKVELIYNGIDGHRFDRVNYSGKAKEVRQHLGLACSTKVVGVVGRLAHIKNHAVLLRAMTKVVQEIDDVALLLVGDGPLRSDIEAMISEHNLGRYVKILGTRSDIPELLSIFDLFVLPSFSEGLSLTLIEACAAGVPIVATRVGGNEEVVVDQQNGLTVPSDDADAMAKAIIHVLSNMERAHQMGTIGRKRFQDTFTLETMVQRYQNLYKSCMQ